MTTEARCSLHGQVLQYTPEESLSGTYHSLYCPTGLFSCVGGWFDSQRSERQVSWYTQFVPMKEAKNVKADTHTHP